MRKMLGGGMRQAGILAAAGIIALETMTTRLLEDHLRARKLSEGLKKIPGIVLENAIPATNMVFLSLEEDVKNNANKIAGNLEHQGILVDQTGNRSFRLVLHYWIDDAGVEKTITAFKSAIK